MNLQRTNNLNSIMIGFSQDLQLFKNLDVSASVYNILDQRYVTPAGPDFIQNVHIQEGRSFRVKFSYSF